MEKDCERLHSKKSMNGRHKHLEDYPAKQISRYEAKERQRQNKNVVIKPVKTYPTPIFNVEKSFLIVPNQLRPNRENSSVGKTYPTILIPNLIFLLITYSFTVLPAFQNSLKFSKRESHQCLVKDIDSQAWLLIEKVFSERLLKRFLI
jgi:hypothetical protein